MKKVVVGFFLFLVLLASSWVLFQPGFFRAHDYVHAARIVEMTQALEQGHFPVRWTAEFGYGYGMPLFEFYAPLPYYLGSSLYWLGLGVVPTIKLLFIASALFTLLGAYRLGSKLFGKSGGILTAAALTLAPYRAVNLFIRGALSEAWGMMALPWVLYGIVQVVRKEKQGWLTLTLSLVVLMLSHNITTMLFVPVSLMFAVGYLLIERFKFDKKLLKVLLELGGSYLLAIGLSAFYIFPALAENQYTKINSILSGYFHYSQHFLYIRQFFQVNWGFTGSVWGPEDGISFFLGWGQLLGLVVVAILMGRYLLLLLKRKSKLAFKRITTFSLMSLLLGFSLWMSLYRSKPVWDLLPPLELAQFPWRWLATATLFLALLIGFALTLIKSRIKRYVVMSLLLAAMLFNAQFFRPNKWLNDPDPFYYTDLERIQTQMSGILPDYIPVQMSDELVPPSYVARCYQADCDDRINVLVDRGHEKLVSTQFDQERELEFAVADFPGWKVEIDGQEGSKAVGELGNIVVPVPAGEHLVGIQFGSTPVRQWSDIATAASLLVLLYLLL